MFPFSRLLLLLLPAFLLGPSASTVLALDIRKCDQPLGMQSGGIRDQQLSSSSTFDPLSTGPAQARLNSESGSGAWCPRWQINGSSHEWVQVDLGSDIVLTAVSTQGRWDRGRGLEYPEAYMVEYWRESLGRWARYKDARGNEIIPANSDTQSAVFRSLDGAIIARLVRLIPVSESTRTVCLRFELYGCPYKGSLSSYSAPVGSLLANGRLDLRDSSYDGPILPGNGTSPTDWMRGGIGRLFDGTRGQQIDFANNHASGWVAWTRDRSLESFVPLEFSFVRRQNVSAILLHTANIDKVGTRPFRFARIHFSPFGDVFSTRTVQWEYSYEEKLPVQSQSGRWLRVPVPHRLATRIRLELVLADDADLLLLSEVDFQSEDSPAANGQQSAVDNDGMLALAEEEQEEDLENEGHRAKVPWPARGCLLFVLLFFAVSLCSVLLICCCCLCLGHRRQSSSWKADRPSALSPAGPPSAACPSSYSGHSLHSKSVLFQHLILSAKRKMDPRKAQNCPSSGCSSQSHSLLKRSLSEEGDQKELLDIARLVIRHGDNGQTGQQTDESDQYADPDDASSQTRCRAAVSFNGIHPSASPRHALVRPSQLHYAARDLMAAGTRRPAPTFQQPALGGGGYSLVSMGDALPTSGTDSPMDGSRYRGTPTPAQFVHLPPPLPPVPPPRRL